ncbi:MAG: 2-oxoacid:acceptor oxidoreductase family protein [Lentisphaerae bacterium]|nr:2-oxoacid:acceptor oxidoreductase family protein [Lentisphaerota bacterium]
MSKPTENRANNATIILSGTGGQGLQLMGRLLAEAAAIHGGLNVVQSRSYGPEARGGASRSQVVLSRGEIDDLRNPSCNVLICLSQQACDRYYTTLRDSGLFIVDSTNVKVVPTTRVVELPMTQMAADACGTRMAANVVGLGVLCGCSNIVSLKALEAATRSTVKAKFVDGNLKALAAGYASAKAFLESLPPARRSTIPDLSFV